MKVWLSHAASLTLVAFALAACGGGSTGSSTSEALVARPVEVPALVTQVEAYQPQASLQALKSRIPLSRGSRPDPARVRLPHLAASNAQGPVRTAPGRPVQIGNAREVSSTSDVQRMRGLLQFKPGAEGEGPTAAVSFTSPGAAGLRLGLLVRELPASARVRGYAQGGETAFELSGRDILAAIGRNRDAGDVSDRGRTFWTPSIDSEEVTLEIALPVGASPDTVTVSVPLLSHLTVKAQELSSLLIGTAGSCEVDVSCVADAAPQSRATAKMIFVDGGFSYLCTGTLLNDTQASGTPYFLSAEHCISSQTIASSLITYWFYRSASCNAQILSPEMRQLNGGATLLYASTDTDTSFMRLNLQPPAGATFAGWSAAPPQYMQELIAVHHPRGDLQKISRGDLTGFVNCSVGLTELFSCGPATQGTGKYLDVTFSLGTVESGSSGSGLFASISGSRYLVGQLKGGNASCQDPAGLNSYGRFDIAYNAALNRWLSPGQTSALNTQAGSASVPRVPVHRFYNSATAAHFYTPNAAERDYVIANYPTFAYEGVAFYAYDTKVIGSYPVYRLYSNLTHRHFYTMAASERDFAVANYQMTDEGISWYAQWGSNAPAIPMYRFYNATMGSHFYTINEAEKAIVLRNYPAFQLEGVAYYAWTTP